jgi:biotin operon repressor
MVLATLIMAGRRGPRHNAVLKSTMASAFSVTPNAIEQAVHRLRHEGWDIYTATGVQGPYYVLTNPPKL